MISDLQTQRGGLVRRGYQYDRLLFHEPKRTGSPNNEDLDQDAVSVERQQHTKQGLQSVSSDGIYTTDECLTSATTTDRVYNRLCHQKETQRSDIICRKT